MVFKRLDTTKNAVHNWRRDPYLLKGFLSTFKIIHLNRAMKILNLRGQQYIFVGLFSGSKWEKIHNYICVWHKYEGSFLSDFSPKKVFLGKNQSVLSKVKKCHPALTHVNNKHFKSNARNHFCSLEQTIIKYNKSIQIFYEFVLNNEKLKSWYDFSIFDTYKN